MAIWRNHATSTAGFYFVTNQAKLYISMDVVDKTFKVEKMDEAACSHG